MELTMHVVYILYVYIGIDGPMTIQNINPFKHVGLPTFFGAVSKKQLFIAVLKL